MRARATPIALVKFTIAGEFILAIATHHSVTSFASGRFAISRILGVACSTSKIIFAVFGRQMRRQFHTHEIASFHGCIPTMAHDPFTCTPLAYFCAIVERGKSVLWHTATDTRATFFAHVKFVNGFECLAAFRAHGSSTYFAIGCLARLLYHAFASTTLELH